MERPSVVRLYRSSISWQSIAEAISEGDVGYLNIGDTITDTLKDGRKFTVEVAAIDPYDTNTMAFVFKEIIANRCMNEDATNAGGWRDSEMRRWLNDEFFNLLPDELQKVIKSRVIWQKEGERTLESVDKLWLPSEVEIFGTAQYSNADVDDVHFELFKNPRNRVRFNNGGTPANWWERSPFYYYSYYFCGVSSNGSATSSNASYSDGVAPAFLI